ncbi:hypothetical protein KIPB_013772 [Kipferlia bialata]|uniref:Uncharacterized protein n=1 Tax=Kipferlia bialata TaxID=797122 RepID=A0A9K3D7W2_9EUKA|nr:hypothetical protein KIPB_013772 [Kipferlia bialata]|eukprot:g13772.t1
MGGPTHSMGCDLWVDHSSDPTVQLDRFDLDSVPTMEGALSGTDIKDYQSFFSSFVTGIREAREEREREVKTEVKTEGDTLML